MATDYISREKAIEIICGQCAFKDACDAGVEPRCSYYIRISQSSAADVRPVVRGHYIGEYDGYADGNPVYDMWYCSECGCCFEDWDEKPTYNFCPNCGADMRR